MDIIKIGKFPPRFSSLLPFFSIPLSLFFGGGGVIFCYFQCYLLLAFGSQMGFSMYLYMHVESPFSLYFH